MLTPAFELAQNTDYLLITIRAPFAKVSETEIFIEENEFKFYSQPYYLRLTLPGNLVEDGREKASYDAEKGSFSIQFPKETPGQHFEGLDMLTKLLTPKGNNSAKQPLIEVIESEGATCADSEGGLPLFEESDVEIDWYIEQKPYEEKTISLDAPKYGFACLRSGIFARLQSEMADIVDIQNPDETNLHDRRAQRLQQEDEKFDDDHYLADLYQADAVEPLLEYVTPWEEALKGTGQSSESTDKVQLTEEDKEKMRNLPRKEYLIDDALLSSVYLGLVDIIYAYAFDHRTTEGERNVESGWTICKLSSTLSWLEVYSSLQDVVCSCFRRALCFPLYRHWQLAITVLKDTQEIFALGRCQLLKCLLDIQSLLTDVDSRYILNDLYITDYCVWIQSASEQKIESLAEALKKVAIQKSDVGFDLCELETAGHLALDEGEMEDQCLETVMENVSKLRLDSPSATDTVVSDMSKLVIGSKTSASSRQVIADGNGCVVSDESEDRDSDDDSSATESDDTSDDDESTETDDSSICAGNMALTADEKECEHTCKDCTGNREQLNGFRENLNSSENGDSPSNSVQNLSVASDAEGDKSNKIICASSVVTV